MNCSKDMDVKRLSRKQRNEIIIRRIIFSWIVVFIIGAVVGFAVTFFTMRTYAMEKNESEKNFTEEVQLVEPFPFETEVVPEVTEVVPESVPEVIEEPKVTRTYLGTYKITAYCSCEICCGSWANNRPDGIVYGASGEILSSNHSCASPLPFGTVVEIDGLGTYTVEDRTATWVAEAADNKIIDIYFESHEEAMAFGCKYLDVYTIE